MWSSGQGGSQNREWMLGKNQGNMNKAWEKVKQNSDFQGKKKKRYIFVIKSAIQALEAQ